jgi:hypothetical protein
MAGHHWALMTGAFETDMNGAGANAKGDLTRPQIPRSQEHAAALPKR